MEITKEGYAVIEGDTHISKWVKENKRLDFDQNAIPLIMKHIKPNDIVIDCGANIGAYSYAFASKANSVVCFEPNPQAFECLKYNLGKLPNVFCLNSAVGSNYDHVNILLSDNAGASQCEISKDGDIEIQSIDSFNFPKVDFIKIDVEGFELEVLKGAFKTLKRDKPKLYIEINKGTLAKLDTIPNDIFGFLGAMGYKYENIHSHEPMEGEQFDIICF